MPIKKNLMLCLCLCMMLISGCAGCLHPVLEPPADYDEPEDVRPGGDPSEWETDNTVPAGGSPSDWGSGEPIMNDGSVPGKVDLKKASKDYTEGAAETTTKSGPVDVDSVKISDKEGFGFYFIAEKPRGIPRLGWHIAKVEPEYEDEPPAFVPSQPRLRMDLDWFTDDTGKPTQPLNPSTAHQAGFGDFSLSGKNRPSGDVFDMSFRNYSGFGLKLGLSLGTFLNPSDSSYQRMITTESKIIDCPDSDTTTTAPITGFCADPKKYPPSPSESDSEAGWTINPSLFHLKEFGGGMTEIPPPTLNLEEEDDDFEPVAPYLEAINPSILKDPFMWNYKYAPFAPQTAEKMIDEGKITVPGFPTDKAKITIGQWAVWNMYSEFTSEDGREKIEKQTEGNTNITPPMKEELNNNLWEGIDLVQKELKPQEETGADEESAEDEENEPFRFKVRVQF